MCSVAEDSTGSELGQFSPPLLFIFMTSPLSFSISERVWCVRPYRHDLGYVTSGAGRPGDRVSGPPVSGLCFRCLRLSPRGQCRLCGRSPTALPASSAHDALSAARPRSERHCPAVDTPGHARTRPAGRWEVSGHSATRSDSSGSSRMSGSVRLWAYIASRLFVCSSQP